MAQVLLTVSGVIDPEITQRVAEGARPRADYLEMARAFDADLMDYAEARRSTGWFGKLLEKVGGADLRLAWACFKRRRRYNVIFTDGEQVGMPLALLCRLAGRQHFKHIMIVHILSVRKKLLLFDLFRLQRYINIFLVYSTWQKRFIEQRLSVPAEQVMFTPFMVDARFFDPARTIVQPRRMICTAGLEFRDYPTLLEAVRDLDVEVVIAAASPWSKREDSTAGQAIPDHVTVRRFSQFELRQLYADSAFVVMPLHSVNFQAGVTAILEAMAMGRAVICTRTPGQTDIIVDGETGLYVPPGDPNALRATIVQLLADPERARRMGEAARRQVERELNLDCYVERLQYVVQAALHENH